MHSEFSEFSYGYAIVDEMINWYGSSLVSAPDFPTTIAEASKGYDARLSMERGFSLFLQFKASDCMIRDTAFETQRGDFTPPFYRFHLRRMSKSKQHEVLLQLEQEKHFVFYVAPGFFKAAELNQAWFARQTSERSIWIRPSDIGQLPDDNYHHVSFTLPRKYRRYSEPKDLQGHYTFEVFKKSIRENLRAPRDSRLTPERIQLLESKMVELISEYITGPRDLEFLQGRREDDASVNPLSRISFLAKTYLDCEFLICAPKAR